MKINDILSESRWGAYQRDYDSNTSGFRRSHRDMSDESNLMYVYREGRLKQGMVSNPNRDRAHAEGFRDTPEQALRLHGIIRSKFDPKKWVQKQGTKWVEVHPYGKQDPVEEGYTNYSDEEQPIKQESPVEAYGYAYNNRDQRVMWRKTFSSAEAAYKWADKKNATILGTSATLDEDLPPPEKARDTQIPGTLPTYKKAAAMLDKAGAKGKAIDFGAGLGLGTPELGDDAESYEPFPKEQFKPHYVDVTKVPSNKYHRLVNLNVLNVVPNVGERRDRDAIVRNIGRVLAPGGVAIITTRGKDVLGAKGTAGEEAWSIITSKGTYQKGFSQKELREYVQSVLGDGFEVQSVKLGPAGVMIKKLEQQVQETIVKKGDEYEVQSKSGKNLGRSDTKAGAVKRLGQVEWFKKHK
jgi:hypothetical protein